MTTKIEWARNADGSPGRTWNPSVGCAKISEGCGIGGGGCYAIGVAHRAMQPAHEGLTIKRPGERPDWTGEVRHLPDRLDVPLRRRTPTTWFVDSMSDLFYEADDLFLSEVWAVMGATPQHTYQILTKRPKQMAALLEDPDGEFRYKVALSRRRHAPDSPIPPWPYPNVWCGASIELDKYAWRANYVRATPAAVRFLSLEPLLGPLPSLDLTGIGWIICGGESGPGARPMHPAWVEELRDRCVAAGIPFLLKQWGEYGLYPPGYPGPGSLGGPAARKAGVAVAYDGRFWPTDELAIEYEDGHQYCDPFNRPFHYVHETGRMLAREYKPGGHRLHSMYRVGKKAAGRELDGRTWDQMPERVPA